MRRSSNAGWHAAGLCEICMEWGSTLHSVVGRFLSLDLALGKDILLITSQVGFTIGVVIAPYADQLSRPHVHRLEPVHPPLL